MRLHPLDQHGGIIAAVKIHAALHVFHRRDVSGNSHNQLGHFIIGHEVDCFPHDLGFELYVKAERGPLGAAHRFFIHEVIDFFVLASHFDLHLRMAWDDVAPFAAV
ncbi:hypothetical protein D3C76_1618590 [compost metagenome]